MLFLHNYSRGTPDTHAYSDPCQNINYINKNGRAKFKISETLNNILKDFVLSFPSQIM